MKNWKKDIKNSLKPLIEKRIVAHNDLEELNMTIEEAEAAYIKSRSKSALKMVQSALNIFVDTGNPEENGNTNRASNQ